MKLETVTIPVELKVNITTPADSAIREFIDYYAAEKLAADSVAREAIGQERTDQEAQSEAFEECLDFFRNHAGLSL